MGYNNADRFDRYKAGRIFSQLTPVRVIHAIGENIFRLTGRRRSGRKIELSTIRQVLVVRPDNIGDVVMATSFLRELRRNLPEAWITLLVKHSVYDLVEFCPYVNETLTFDWRYVGVYSNLASYWRKLWKHRFHVLNLALRHLFPRRFDLAILPRFDVDWYHATFATYFSGAPWRVGYSDAVTESKRQLNRGYDRLLSHPIEDSSLKHEVEHNLDVITFLGGKVQSDQLELWLSPEEEKFVNEFLYVHNVFPNDMLIAFGVGASLHRRMWPIDRFLEVGLWLKNVWQARILLIGAKDENSLGKKIQRQLGNTLINIAGQTTLRQTSVLLKHCHLYVGNDSGPMHLSAAVRTPVIEISCHPQTGSLQHSNSPRRFGPWAVTYAVLQPKNAIHPCLDGCDSDNPHCILSITVEQVKEAIRAQLPQQHR